MQKDEMFQNYRWRYKMTVNYGTSIVMDNLIALVDAANPRSYPGSGSVWSDISQNGANTTLSGGYSYSSTGTLTFNGLTAYGTMTTNRTLAECTMIAWINSAANQNSYTGVFTVRTSANFGIVISGAGTNIVNTMWNDTGWSTNTGLVIPNNKWCMVAGIASAGNALTTYLNNISYTTTGTYATQAMINPLIGNDTSTGSRFFNGIYGAVLIYNRALSATEMTQNFNAYRGRYGI
jgi:hypothetical protein